MAALHECVGDLADPARELLRMKHTEGLATAVIADRLRWTTAAVAQNLCRVHRALRECVERKLGRAAAPSTGELPT